MLALIAVLYTGIPGLCISLPRGEMFSCSPFSWMKCQSPMLNLSVQSDAGGPESSHPCTVWLLAWEHSSVLGTPWEIPSMNSLCWTRTQGIEIPGLMCADGTWDPLEKSECPMVQTIARCDVSSGELKLKSPRMQQRDYFQGEEA